MLSWYTQASTKKTDLWSVGRGQSWQIQKDTTDKSRLNQKQLSFQPQ